MKPSNKKIIAYIYILYAITTIYTPKIGIGGLAGIYFFEPICIAISSSLLLSNKFRFTSIERSYFAYLIFSVLSWLIGRFYWGFFDFKSLMILIKYSSFILLIPAAFYLKDYLTETVAKRILYSQVLFVAIAGMYVLYNTLFKPVSLLEMFYGYSRQYRLVGSTGLAFSPQGLTHIGNTSVQMGVYIAVLFLIFVSLYFYMKKPRYLFISFALFAGLMLTYSRSGLLVMLMGIICLLSFNILKKRVVKLTFILISSTVTLALFTDLPVLISRFGSLGKLVNAGFGDSGRIRYWNMGLDYIMDNPLDILFGAGYDSIYNIFRIGTLESLFFDTLVGSGVFALVFLLLFIYCIWSDARKYSMPVGSNNFSKAVLYGYYLSIPGLIIANTVGGNSIQTDFMAPTFFLVFGICLAHTKKITLVKD